MIIFIGVSGSGKSVQGRLLAEEMGYTWISSGKFLRLLLDGQDRQAMTEGKLLPDQEVIDMLDKVLKLRDPDIQCVLDGFPRTLTQTAWLLSQTKNGRFKIDMIFHLSLDHAVARERLLGRNRIDDHELAIKQRLSEYNTVTRPILDKFKHESVAVWDIDASRSIEVVHKEIINIARQGA